MRKSMNPRNILKDGDVVWIDLDPHDYAVTPGMLKYNHQPASISRRICGGYGGQSVWYIYELEDVVSPYGIPYGFTRDMIRRSNEFLEEA